MYRKNRGGCILKALSKVWARRYHVIKQKARPTKVGQALFYINRIVYASVLSKRRTSPKQK